jgi:hypothetical protein
VGLLGLVVLFGSGVMIAFHVPSAFMPGGWLTAVVLLIFAFVGRYGAKTGRRTLPSPR